MWASWLKLKRLSVPIYGRENVTDHPAKWLTKARCGQVEQLASVHCCSFSSSKKGLGERPGHSCPQSGSNSTGSARDPGADEFPRLVH
ncbi:unnamed protein product [Nippostrongylus brasiliensis]|uniref:Uncharacterized protein n=1 Tax=Nippostrongylus brasiliensis TaxID=27835 RepID=A0A0N4YEA9_NIPBR|nr:unnamed protein product [Nippostrongylus brasiliensis]